MAENQQVLLMKYHPAKKEVQFRRYQNGKEVPIRSDSRLMPYMVKWKGKFVLQDHGKDLFDDIVKAFDSLQVVEMHVITTKLDYEDLEQMVEFYNNNSQDCKITTTLIAELPDMNKTFLAVKSFGEDAKEILRKHKKVIEKSPQDVEKVQESVIRFSSQLEEEIRNIDDKINSLEDNNVSLCFTGVYSSGKSAIINAILGYRILPEAVSSETAKMFRIYSPRKNEKVKIIFAIDGNAANLEWNVADNCFEFESGPSETVTRAEIQKILYEQKENQRPQYEQISRILAELNKKTDVSSEITIVFPVPIDNDSVQFTIYDTPGTDSNYEEHQRILFDALSVQTQSILVFVAQPTKLEGEGNNTLLRYIKEADEKDSKTSIDIGRSMFVINFADTIRAKDREELREKEICSKDDLSISIKLCDKKLFFTSAIYGLAAKAVNNGSAGEEEDFYVTDNRMTSERSPVGRCFLQNNFAASESATRTHIEKNLMALREANGDQSQENYICSGLYALESEIRAYGEKYASAVRTFAIIQSVDKALEKLRSQAESIRESAQEEIETIEANIKELKQTIQQTVSEAYDRYAIKASGSFPSDTLKKLHIDNETKNRRISKICNVIKKNLSSWFFKVAFVSDKHVKMVEETISTELNSFTVDFMNSRKSLLEKLQTAYKQDVIKAIKDNGKISQSAKTYFENVPDPEIPNLGTISEIEKLYAEHERKWWFIKSLDKEGFVAGIETRLSEQMTKMVEQYCCEYTASLSNVLNQVKDAFMNHLDEYSVDMQAMIADKEAMKKLGAKINDAAEDLTGCQNGLNAVIWKEKD